MTFFFGDFVEQRGPGWTSRGIVLERCGDTLHVARMDDPHDLRTLTGDVWTLDARRCRIVYSLES
jgi:hypothetical protein